nr:proline synthase co-transcribed bacterial homolog protein-like [Ipomoea batatas]
MAAPAVENAAATALRAVLHRVRVAAERSGRRADDVRVVAVGKTKPSSLIRQVYDAGHTCFGENYVQEIIQKAPELPEDIEWHFIGHLQSNKVKSLLTAVPHLAMVEGVDNEKVANHLDRAISSIGRQPLKVLVQVNTSGEESKSGIDPSYSIELAKHVKLNCPNLEFSGLMTIGRPDYTSTPENFKVMLLNCRTEICKVLGMTEAQCELSMGMSGDFEQAYRELMANLPQDPSMTMRAVAGVEPYNGWKVQSAEELLIDICNPQLREKALRQLCESLAVHPETRIPFLNACIPYYVYPFLKPTSYSTPLEKLRISSLCIICGIVKEGETKAIEFLLATEVMPLCLCSMEIGDTLSKQAATFILQKLLSDDMGLEYICTTVARLLAVVQTLKNMVVLLSEKPSSEMLKQIIQCYIRLCDDSRARDKLRYYLPDRLRDATFSNCFEEDPDTKMSLQHLLCIVNNA